MAIGRNCEIDDALQITNVEHEEVDRVLVAPAKTIVGLLLSAESLQ